MNRRSVVWVGLFGGLGAALVLWLVMSDPAPTPDPPTPLPERTAVLAEGDAPLTKATIGAERLVAEGPVGARLRRDRGHRLPLLRDPSLLRRQPSEQPTYASNTEGLERAINARDDDLRSCLQAARVHDPDLPSRFDLTVGFEDANGSLRISTLTAGLPESADSGVLEGVHVFRPGRAEIWGGSLHARRAGRPHGRLAAVSVPRSGEAAAGLLCSWGRGQA